MFCSSTLQGVTYCGSSKASSLTINNVPYHDEVSRGDKGIKVIGYDSFVFLAQVVEFVQKLVEYLPDYELVCEHEHSTCVLAAHKRVRPSCFAFTTPPSNHNPPLTATSRWKMVYMD